MRFGNKIMNLKQKIKKTFLIFVPLESVLNNRCSDFECKFWA